jgi:NAD(P)H-hydrate epimerase
MSGFPLTIHSAEQVRALDAYAIEQLGIPGYTLMCRAGEALLGAFVQRWPRARRVAVLCGPGNNGGDGYVFARLAIDRGLDVRLMSVVDVSALRGDARRAYEHFTEEGGQVLAWHPQHLEEADVLIDALFGSGLTRTLEGTAKTVVDAINASGVAVLAVDVPSGLHADTGAVMGVAIRADCTLTFVGLKAGLYLGEGPACSGVILFDALALPGAALAEVPAVALRIDEHLVRHSLPPRVRTAHKGMHGDVLIVGGGRGMPGAARLAGEAALRCGAGRVTIAAHPENVAAIVSGRPELMCRGVQSQDEASALMERADVVAIGPGLGQDEWAVQMWRAGTLTHKPLVIDADALNLLAAQPVSMRSRVLVMTPHPAEAGRLLKLSTQEIQRDRLSAVRQLATHFECVAILKGACSLVANSTALPAVCDRGNPGMATAGMGDVLTGALAGLLAQLHDPLLAAQTAVWVHAAAGDRAATQQGERGLIASDLFEHLRACVNPKARG